MYQNRSKLKDVSGQAAGELSFQNSAFVQIDM